jgi:pimeloyl-ACP methyl ester carboxylesterase
MAVERARANGIEIAYETFGDAGDPPLLLIMGIGSQMINWPEGFCEQLAGRALFAIRFDNRDAGESTHLDDAGKVNVTEVLGGDYSSAPYTLSDMADDAAGLLDALGIESAHIVGASMGGMIAQTFALEHPDRTRSLTSIMSTTGDRQLPQATEEAQAILLQPSATSREELMRRAPETGRVLGSPGFEIDEDYLRERAGRAWDRGYDPAGFGRQFGAIYRSGNRTELLRSLRVPALVIHGEDDPLIRVEAGRATAAAIEGAELVTIPGMGHDFPRGAWPLIIDPIAGLVERVERERAGVAAADVG